MPGLKNRTTRPPKRTIRGGLNPIIPSTIFFRGGRYFRGRRYYFYREFARLTDAKAKVRELRKKGYRTRLTGFSMFFLRTTVVYTNPKAKLFD